MNIDYLSQLPVDLFIQNITYLPFDDVVSVCSANIKLHNYCNDPKYNNHWKNLIDSTFGNIYDYQNHLKEIWKELNLNEGAYNYLVYTQLVKLLDPITQLMIYYRQGDMKSFDKFNKTQKFLAMFLLNKKDKIRDYLPDVNYLPFTDMLNYLPFIDMLNGDKITSDILDRMLIAMAKEGSIKGVKYFEKLGANLHANNDAALRSASYSGYLEEVKYLVKQGADIHAEGDYALRSASYYGHLEVVKYLVKEGADIHVGYERPLTFASRAGHLDIVKFLVEKGANVQADDDEALRWASGEGHLDVVKYLVTKGANIHALGEQALYRSSYDGHLEVVKYLVENGADIHVNYDAPVKIANENGYIEVVNYLLDQGANIHAYNPEHVLPPIQ